MWAGARRAAGAGALRHAPGRQLQLQSRPGGARESYSYRTALEGRCFL